MAITKQFSSDHDKLRVLISGALPPPMGGVGAYYQTLLSSSLPDHVDMRFVQTSSQKRELSGTGKPTLSNFIAAFQDCWRFTKAVLTFHPQLAHISTAIGLSFIKHSICVFVARLFGSRVLLHPHCSLAVLYYQRPKWWQWYFRQVMHVTDGVVALSREWLQLSSIDPRQKVFYLPNAINVKLFRNIADKHLLEVSEKKPSNVLYIGSLDKSKGTFDLIEAAANIHSSGMVMFFDLVGGALVFDDEKRMLDIIKGSNLNDVVRLQPITFGQEKLNYLQAADIFVYPSYNEGMPMAVLEAMACGLPVIASSVGGLPDLIQDGVNGFLVDPGKPEQITSALCKLAIDPGLRLSMGKKSFELVTKQYDVESHVIHLIEIYQQVLSNNLISATGL